MSKEVVKLIDAIEWPVIGMTLEECAKSLRVDPKTIRTFIKAGDFPARKVGRGYRIDPDAVKRWLDTREPKGPISGPGPGWFKKAHEAGNQDAEDEE